MIITESERCFVFSKSPRPTLRQPPRECFGFLKQSKPLALSSGPRAVKRIATMRCAQTMPRLSRSRTCCKREHRSASSARIHQEKKYVYAYELRIYMQTAAAAALLSFSLARSLVHRFLSFAGRVGALPVWQPKKKLKKLWIVCEHSTYGYKRSARDRLAHPSSFFSTLPARWIRRLAWIFFFEHAYFTPILRRFLFGE